MDFELKDKSDIEGTEWIEFNVSGMTDGFDRYWSDNSKYLDEDVYNLFTDIFAKHADHFDHYLPTVFKPEQMDRIKTDIENRTTELEKLTSLDDLINFCETMNAIILSTELEENYHQLKDQKETLTREIKELGNRLIELLNHCIANNKPLWIIGL